MFCRKAMLPFGSHQANPASLQPMSSQERVLKFDVSGERKSTFEGHRFAVFSPDGRTIATPRTSSAHAVQLVNANSGESTLSMDSLSRFKKSAVTNLVGTKGIPLRPRITCIQVRMPLIIEAQLLLSASAPGAHVTFVEKKGVIQYFTE